MRDFFSRSVMKLYPAPAMGLSLQTAALWPSLKAAA